MSVCDLSLGKGFLRNTIVFILLIIIPLLLSIPVIERFTTNEDEGISLYGAIRVLNGQVPYRDFWHIILPGAVWVIAGAFKVFGVHLLTARTLTLLFIIGQGILIYLISRRYIEKSTLFMASLILYLFNIIPSINFTPHKPAVFFSLLALLFYLKDRYLLSGFSASLSLFMQQNIGALTFLGVVLSIFAGKYIFEKDKEILKGLSNLVVGFSIPLLFFLIYIFLAHAQHEVYYALFVWPFQGYMEFNRYPYFNCEFDTLRMALSTSSDLHIISRIIVLGTLIFIGFLPCLLFLSQLILSIRHKNGELFKITLCGIFLFLSAFTRPDFLHILYSLPVFFALFFFTIVGVRRKFYSVIAIILLFTVLTERGLAFLQILFTPHKVLETERGKVRVPAYNYETIYGLFSMVGEYTSPDDKIFIYHWNPTLYFYLNRNNPTRFDSYISTYNTPEQLNQIIETLKTNPPRVVIKDIYIERIIHPEHPISLSCSFPKVPRDRLKEDPVDEYIMENYNIALDMGVFKIYIRK